MTCLKPLLKWAGGKRKQVPLVKPIYDRFRDRRFVDLFAGGLSMSLGLQPEQCLYGDANIHLMNFYDWVKNDGVARFVKFTNEEEHYYIMRNTFNARIQAGKTTGAINAELFYYLNRTGFNGLCRFNQSGLFNVPYGHYDYPAYERDFTLYQPTLNNWVGIQDDFRFVLQFVKPGDFIYADPPYDTEFTAYNAGGFDWTEQVDLANLLARHDGPVIATNQATPRIIALYRDLGFDIAFDVREDKMNRYRPKGNEVKELFATRGI